MVRPLQRSCRKLPFAEDRRRARAVGEHDRRRLAKLPAVRMLRQVWAEQYIEENGQIRWREVKEMPAPSSLISSPYDSEARYSKKRETTWVGYKVHLTE